MTTNRIPVHRQLSVPGKLTVAALLLTALAYAAELLSLGLDREVSIVVLVLLGVAGLAATGWPLMPALGALVAGAILVLNPFLVFNLSSPANGLFFSAALAQIGATLVAVGAGIATTVQQLRRWRRRQ